VAQALLKPRLLPRFVADVHLGKLARHLRMVGLDTLWREDFADAELARIAREEGRILLTRDRALHESVPPEQTHYVQATDPAEQLRETLARYELTDRAREGQGFLSRCLECNSPILPCQGHQLLDRLPPSVRLQHREFFLCARCERVYWKGSHYDRMLDWVRRALGA
jgi:uncharacterized protein with PIN domain